MKYIDNPDPRILRLQAQTQAKHNEYPTTACPHPASAIGQFIDEEAGRAGRPTNLFQCDICKTLLWLVDPYGKTATDG